MKVLNYFLIVVATKTTTTTAASSPPIQEVSALRGLFTETGGRNDSSSTWINSTGWDNMGSDDPCHWFGVACNSTNSLSNTSTNIIGLRLSNNGLEGKIPSSQLPVLSSLEHMDLSKNAFAGTLPTSICDIGSSLRYLGFWQNSLTGTIPSCYGSSFTNLNGLSLEANSLTGTIPASLGEIGSSLKTIWLYANRLTGTLSPTLFSALSALETFDARSNLLSGSLDVTCSLTHIKNLIIWNNSFTGSVPACIGENLADLEILALGGNELKGSIPPTLCNIAGSAAASRPLKWVLLSDNSITGTIPACFGGLHYLTDFQVGNNFLSGSLPSQLCSASSLEFINFENNRLTGTIPSCSSGDWPSMNSYVVYHNKLEGTLPSSFCGGTFLYHLQVYGNRLTGTIPSCLGSQAPSLISLQVQDNRLTGSLPSLWSSPALKSFVASNNARLGGTLPSSLFTHCPSLVALVMEGTMLSGRLPASLGGGENFSASLLNLETIALAGNRLTGPLPRNVSHLGRLATFQAPLNRLSGPLPEDLGALTSLRRLLLNDNLLSGTLSHQLALLAPQLERVDLGLNRLSCDLPPQVLNWRRFNGSKYRSLDTGVVIYETSAGDEATSQKKSGTVNMLEGNLFSCSSSSWLERFLGLGSLKDSEREVAEKDDDATSNVNTGGSSMVGAPSLYQQDRHGASYRCGNSPYALATLAAVVATTLCLIAIAFTASLRLRWHRSPDTSSSQKEITGASSASGNADPSFAGRVGKVMSRSTTRWTDEITPRLGWYWSHQRLALHVHRDASEDLCGGFFAQGGLSFVSFVLQEPRSSLFTNDGGLGPSSRHRTASSAWKEHRQQTSFQEPPPHERQKAGVDPKVPGDSESKSESELELANRNEQRAMNLTVAATANTTEPVDEKAGFHEQFGQDKDTGALDSGLFAVASGLVTLGISGVGFLFAISVLIALPTYWFGSESRFTCQYLGHATFAYKSSFTPVANAAIGCVVALTTIVVSRPVWRRDPRLLAKPPEKALVDEQGLKESGDARHEKSNQGLQHEHRESHTQQCQRPSTPEQAESVSLGDVQAMSEDRPEGEPLETVEPVATQQAWGLVWCGAVAQLVFCAVLTVLPNVAYVLVLLDSKTTASVKALAQLGVTLAKVGVSSLVVPAAAQYTLNALHRGESETDLGVVDIDDDEDRRAGEGGDNTESTVHREVRGENESVQETQQSNYDEERGVQNRGGWNADCPTTQTPIVLENSNPEGVAGALGANTTTTAAAAAAAAATATAFLDYSAARVYRQRVVVEVVHGAISMIGIPMAVVLCVDPRCFYYALAPPREVTTTVYTPFCADTATDGTCLKYESREVDSTYQFRFDFDSEICLVALFETYVPVFVAAPIVSAALDILLGEFLIPSAVDLYESWQPFLTRWRESGEVGVANAKEDHTDSTSPSGSNDGDDVGMSRASNVGQFEKSMKKEMRWATSHWFTNEERRMKKVISSSANSLKDRHTVLWLENLEENLVLVARRLAERCRRRLLLLLLYGCTFGLGAALVAAACVLSAGVVLVYHLHLMGRVHALASSAQSVLASGGSSVQPTASPSGAANALLAENRMFVGRLTGWGGFAPQRCGACLGVTTLLFWAIIAVGVVDVAASAIGLAATFAAAFLLRRTVFLSASPLQVKEHVRDGNSEFGEDSTSHNSGESRSSFHGSMVNLAMRASGRNSVRGSQRSSVEETGDLEMRGTFSRFNPMAEVVLSHDEQAAASRSPSANTKSPLPDVPGNSSEGRSEGGVVGTSPGVCM